MTALTNLEKEAPVVISTIRPGREVFFLDDNLVQTGKIVRATSEVTNDFRGNLVITISYDITVGHPNRDSRRVTCDAPRVAETKAELLSRL